MVAFSLLELNAVIMLVDVLDCHTLMRLSTPVRQAIADLMLSLFSTVIFFQKMKFLLKSNQIYLRDMCSPL